MSKTNSEAVMSTLMKMLGSAVMLSIAFSFAAMAETRLLMFEEDGCPYCDQWHAEIGVVYNKTREGIRAPVTVLDVDDKLPNGVKIGAVPYFTPTFVLIDDGVEIGRIEGYPGEDFFYWMVDQILEKIPGKGSKS